MSNLLRSLSERLRTLVDIAFYLWRRCNLSYGFPFLIIFFAMGGLKPRTFS
jgi:hypothetical protein